MAASPARLYCLLVGAVLVIAGIIGFFYEASFATGDSIRTDDVFGVLSVNGWHNLVHDDVLFKLVPVNNEDNVLHLILGITGVIAYFASRPLGRTATA